MRLKDEKFYKTVRDFLDIYLIRHKGYSLNTQKSYREAINLLLLYFKMERGLEYANVGFEDITYSNITGFSNGSQNPEDVLGNGESAFDGNSFFHKICRNLRFWQNLYASRSRQHLYSENSGNSCGVSDGTSIGNSFLSNPTASRRMDIVISVLCG